VDDDLKHPVLGRGTNCTNVCLDVQKLIINRNDTPHRQQQLRPFEDSSIDHTILLELPLIVPTPFTVKRSCLIPLPTLNLTQVFLI